MNYLYKKAPWFVQNLLCTAYGYKEKRIRFGNEFDSKMSFLQETDSWTKTDIKNYQDDQLQELVKTAFEHTPYYNKLFKKHGLSPDDIKSNEDLYKIPVTSKEDVRNNRDDFVNTSFDKNNLIKRKTSGTTGKSLSFYSTKDAISFQWAVWWRHRARFGFNFGDKHLNFTGKPVVPLSQTNTPYWRWNQAFHQALINMQIINKRNTPAIVDFINKEKFNYWTGYPSIIHNFCSNVLELGLSLDYKPKAIFLGAENIYDHQRNDIKFVTDAVITDQYGFTEGCGNASQCENLNHHVDFEFGIIECGNERRLDNDKKQDDIICTGFANKAFPLIRYEVGDVGVWSDSSFSCDCGRSSEILERIEGRTDDYVITPEGVKIMRFDYLFKDTPEIREAQVVQNELNKISINIVKRNDYSTKTENRLKQNVKTWISPNMDVSFNYLNEIPKEQNGKFRAVKSNIK